MVIKEVDNKLECEISASHFILDSNRKQISDVSLKQRKEENKACTHALSPW